MRDIYIMGYKDGIQEEFTLSILPMSDKYEISEEEKELRNKIWDFLLFNDESIRNVANDLYKDLANTYIPYREIIGIAYRKLCGDSIDLLLLEAIKRAIFSP